MLVNLIVIRLGCRLPLQQRCLGPFLTNATVETVLFRIFTQISTCRENVFLSSLFKLKAVVDTRAYLQKLFTGKLAIKCALNCRKGGVA